MSERVWLENDIISQQSGTNGLNVDELKEDLLKLLELQADLQKRKIPVRLLFDASNTGQVNSLIRKQAIHNMSQLNYDRVGVFGVKTSYLKHVAKLVIKGLGKEKKIRIFDTKEDAEKWLTGK